MGKQQQCSVLTDSGSSARLVLKQYPKTVIILEKLR